MYLCYDVKDETRVRDAVNKVRWLLSAPRAKNLFGVLPVDLSTLENCMICFEDWLDQDLAME